MELLVHQHVKENEALPSWCSEDVRKVAQQLPAGGWQEYKKWRPVPDFKDEYLAWVARAVACGLPDTAAGCITGAPSTASAW